MTHTPGKLRVVPGLSALHIKGEDRYVARTGTDCLEDEANAERLAHCWNCHEDLLAALKAMLAHTEPNCGITGQQSVWNVARKVIADAEGK